MVSIEDFFLQHGCDKNYWIAYSGGLDSHVLLDLCYQVSHTLAIPFKAIHVNHHLSPNAENWVNHCKNICTEYGIPLIVKPIHLVKEKGYSLEELGREARYQAFAEVLMQNDVLLTAHHRDDQAETLLLQLFRGAGPKGLAAMPTVKGLAKGWHGRPLLEVDRSVLRSYALSRNLNWIEDESNQHCHFTRNFIRKDVLPILKKRWPTITKVLARSATHCADMDRVFDEWLAVEIKEVRGTRVNTLSVTKLLTKSVAKQRLLLRTWIEEQQERMLDTKRINAIINNILHARWDAQPKMDCNNKLICRYRDDIFLINKQIKIDNQKVFQWDFSSPLCIENVGVLKSSNKTGQGLQKNIPNVLIRFRQGGESIYLKNGMRRPLKNLFQEWGALPWERERIPLLFSGETLIGVVGYDYDPNFLVKDEREKGYLLELEPG